jgi:hypothetical protein
MEKVFQYEARRVLLWPPTPWQEKASGWQWLTAAFSRDIRVVALEEHESGRHQMLH